MSAFAVSQNHIRALVNFAQCYRQFSHGPFSYYHNAEHHKPSATELGQMLHAENVASVDYRYGNSEEPVQQFRDDFTKPISPVQCLKAIACLEYQSCEHPGWESSAAKAALDSLQHVAINALPGYEDASWEITA